jgi:hypothetical protein
MSEPNLPDRASDELEVGWGDDLSADAEDRSDDERLEGDRPPHYDDRD